MPIQKGPANLGTGSVDSTELASTLDLSAKTVTYRTIVAGDIASGAITTAKITDANITPAKMANSGAELGMRNRIINGSMVIDQRNAGAAQTITTGGGNQYTVDRWYAVPVGANVTGQQITSANISTYRFTGAASNTNIYFIQRIEAKNIADCASSTVTLSCNLANSLLTTVTWTAYYPTASDNYAGYTQIATGTFTVNSTLTNYSAQISLPSSASNGLMIQLNVGAQTSGTWTISNVQLEKGSTATSFDYRPYGTELSLCQRYYIQYTMPVGTGGGAASFGCCINGTIADSAVIVPVPMRVTSTSLALTTNTLAILVVSSGVSYSSGTFAVGYLTNNLVIHIRYTHGSAVFTGGVACLLSSSGASGYLGLSGEL